MTIDKGYVLCDSCNEYAELNDKEPNARRHELMDEGWFHAGEMDQCPAHN